MVTFRTSALVVSTIYTVLVGVPSVFFQEQSLAALWEGEKPDALASDGMTGIGLQFILMAGLLCLAARSEDKAFQKNIALIQVISHGLHMAHGSYVGVDFAGLTWFAAALILDAVCIGAFLPTLINAPTSKHVEHDANIYRTATFWASSMYLIFSVLFVFFGDATVEAFNLATTEPLAGVTLVTTRSYGIAFFQLSGLTCMFASVTDSDTRRRFLLTMFIGYLLTMFHKYGLQLGLVQTSFYDHAAFSKVYPRQEILNMGWLDAVLWGPTLYVYFTKNY